MINPVCLIDSNKLLTNQRSELFSLAPGSPPVLKVALLSVSADRLLWTRCAILMFCGTAKLYITAPEKFDCSALRLFWAVACAIVILLGRS